MSDSSSILDTCDSSGPPSPIIREPQQHLKANLAYHSRVSSSSSSNEDSDTIDKAHEEFDLLSLTHDEDQVKQLELDEPLLEKSSDR